MVAYTVCSLLASILIIAMYTVQVYASHQKCLDESNHDVMRSIVRMSLLGLGVMLSDCINECVARPYIQALKAKQEMCAMPFKKGQASNLDYS